MVGDKEFRRRLFPEDAMVLAEDDVFGETLILGDFHNDIILSL